jgi:23S rRNA pseudouridine1911/1915/1917 synthase
MIPVVYEEPHFLLVNKPAALFSQAAGHIDSLQGLLTQQLKVRDAHPGEPFVGLPHRLDRGTSGIMLIARNQRALKRFGEQFQSRKVVKHYLAVVEGEFPTQAQSWHDYLRKVVDQPKAEIVSAAEAGAKPAIATANRLFHQDGLSLLLVQLETGRMHQIRVQAAARGYPIVGDAAYGALRSFGSATDDADVPHVHPPLPLHAWSLQFHHPQTAKVMKFCASVPQSWSSLPSGLWQQAQSLQQPQ